jgi:UDP-N-acetyl-D-glucosamine dehydrogenase
MQKVAVIGQGYVGLPLALAAAEVGFLVKGIDTDHSKVRNLNMGITSVEGIAADVLSNLLVSKKYLAVMDFQAISDSDVILICVPTPLTESGKPDLQFLNNAAKNVALNMKKDCLVILESTVEPGTTRNHLLKLLRANSKYSSFHVAFSPERIDPGNKNWNLKNTPKIVAGLDKYSTNLAVKFYSEFVDKVVVCDSVEIAETAKLLENTFRLINISFINEFNIFCAKLGMNINEVILAASTKPYGFMPFFPSIGVGGHCIPVDPLYLSNKAKEIGAPTEFIKLAIKVNEQITSVVVTRAKTILGSLANKSVIVLGVAYKSNISDVRETPVRDLILKLRQEGAKVSWHDELVREWNGEKSTPLSPKYDLAIIATPHDDLDLQLLGDIPILNSRSSI